MVKLLMNFTLVIVNMIADLWIGFFNRNSDFYDKHTRTNTKTGYVVFVTLSTVVSIAIVSWIYMRLA